MDNKKPIGSSKRGFASHPENINRNGQPRKGTSFKAIMEEALAKIEPRSGKPFKEYIAENLVLMAANGNLKAIDIFIRLTEGYVPDKRQEVPYDPDEGKTEEELLEEYYRLRGGKPFSSRIFHPTTENKE